MSSEELLHALGRTARDAHARDESLLQRYAAGELSAAEHQELERRVAADPEFAARCDLYRPLEPGEQTEILAALAPMGGVPKRRRSMWALVMPPIAAAAAIALFVGTRGERAAPLPPYSLEVQRAVSSERGATTVAPSLLRLVPEVSPVFLLRPERAIQTSVDARLFVRGAQNVPPRAGPPEAWKSWPHQAERAPGGSIRLTIGALANLPISGTLGICVFDSAAGAPSTATFDEDARCSRFLLTFEKVTTPGHPRPEPR